MRQTLQDVSAVSLRMAVLSMRDYNAESLLSIFPRSLKVSPDYWTIAQVVAPELERLFNAAMLAGIYYRVNELPENVLDDLAVELDVFWWKPDATLAEKREGIMQALASHRRLGTTQAVQDAINTFLGGGVVEEWFDYSGDPFHFQITGADVAGIMENYPAFLRVLDGVKRASAIMDELEDSYLTDENDNLLLYTDDSPLTT